VSILYAPLLHQSRKQRSHFGASTEADTDDTNLCMRVLLSPLACLLDELLVHLFGAFIDGVSSDVIPHFRKRGVLLGTRTWNVPEPNVRVVGRLDLLSDQTHIGDVIRVMDHVVASTIHCRHEQPLVWVIGMQKHRLLE